MHFVDKLTRICIYGKQSEARIVGQPRVSADDIGTCNHAGGSIQGGHERMRLLVRSLVVADERVNNLYIRYFI